METVRFLSLLQQLICAQQHLCRLGARNGGRAVAAVRIHAAGRQARHSGARPIGNIGALERGGGGGFEKAAEHDGGLGRSDAALRVEHDCRAVRAAVDVPVHDRGRDVGLGPRRDLLVVSEAGREHALQCLRAGQLRAHGEKLITRHCAVGVEEILPANLPANAQPLLGEHDGGVFLRAAGHVAVGDVRLLLLDGNEDGRLLRFVAAAVGGAEAEVVAPALAVSGRVDECAAVGERYRALDGLGRDTEGEWAAIGRVGAQRAANGCVAECGQLQIFGHGCGTGCVLFGKARRDERRAERQRAHSRKNFLLHIAKPPCKCRLNLVCTEVVEICVLVLLGPQGDDRVFFGSHAGRDEARDERQRHADENQQNGAEHRQNGAQSRQTGQMVHDEVDRDQ